MGCSPPLALSIRSLFLGYGLLLTQTLGAVDFTIDPPHPITFSGLIQRFSVEAREEGGPVASKEVALSVKWPDGSSLVLEPKEWAKGKASYEIAIPDEMKLGYAALELEAPSVSRKTVAQLDILEKERFERLDALATSISLQRPLRILYLGDSLTAQQAGSNHVDKLHFWLEKYHPGKTTFYNAAVGGDAIRTVWRRFQHLLNPAKAPQYQQELYEGIFAFQPDVIFIFLGHNDTKATSRSGLTQPWIRFEVQEQSFRSVLALLKEKTSAEVVLISSVSPDLEVTRKRAATSAAKGRETYHLHGVPALMERYNEQLKRIADEYGLDYVDVYTPTKNHPDKASLFNPHDGVHLTAEGHRVISTLLLEYLAGSNRVLGEP